jgi:hypothetical protein
MEMVPTIVLYSLMVEILLLMLKKSKTMTPM